MDPCSFPGGSDSKSAHSVGDLGPILGSERERQPTSEFLPGDFHWQRSLAGYSPWGHKDSDTIKQLTFSSGTVGVMGTVMYCHWDAARLSSSVNHSSQNKPNIRLYFLQIYLLDIYQKEKWTICTRTFKCSIFLDSRESEAIKLLIAWGLNK